MSGIDLFLLGCIADRPNSAYDLANFLLGNHLDEMIKISTPAVYKNLLKLADKGLLVATNTRSGKMPEKRVYSLTDKGREELRTQLGQLAELDISFSMDFNSFILNLGKVPKEESFELLERFKANLQEKRLYIEGLRQFYSNVPFEGRAIMKQYSMVLETLSLWLDDFMAEYSTQRQ